MIFSSGELAKIFAPVSTFIPITVSDEEINSGFYEIRPGDTLDEIINRAIGDTSIRNEILREAFVRANPNSFRNSNPNYMFSGVKIRMPTADDIIGLLFKADSRELSSTSRSRESWVYFP
mgnify:CR=1 FL=1